MNAFNSTQPFAGFLKAKLSKDLSTANTIVCIAGAHRSGTSMVARLLHNGGL